MSKAEEALFISDLHLSAERPETVERFLHFLKERAPAAGALYILGDLFDAWIGDDDDAAPWPEIQSALAGLSHAGTKVLIQHGNRDFLIGTAFCERTGASLFNDEAVIKLFGTPTLLMHGDTLCTDDTAYQEARKLLRSAAFKQEFLSKSLQERALIATEYRKRSGEATSLLPADIMDVNQQAVEEAMRRNGVHRLIHGHTHRQAIHVFDLAGKPAERIVLGEWHPDSGMALSVTPDGIDELVV